MFLADDTYTAYGLEEQPHDRGRSPPGRRVAIPAGRRFLLYI